MPEMQKYQQGEFCWFELATTDPKAVTPFYTQIFGWTTREDPLPDGSMYITFLKDGKSVAACAAQQQMEREQGIPPHWNNYIAVDDVEEITARAEELGAKTIAPPFDVMELGKMSVITDSTGAIISFWQDEAQAGAALINESGARVWNDLVTPDLPGAITFYTELFGYSTQTWDPETGYTVLSLGETQWGGIMAPQQDGMPPAWMVHFGIDDARAAVAKVRELGGSVLMEPTEVEKVGTVAVVTDPTGSAFGLVQADR